MKGKLEKIGFIKIQDTNSWRLGPIEINIGRESTSNLRYVHNSDDIIEVINELSDNGFRYYGPGLFTLFQVSRYLDDNSKNVTEDIKIYSNKYIYKVTKSGHYVVTEIQDTSFMTHNVLTKKQFLEAVSESISFDPDEILTYNQDPNGWRKILQKGDIYFRVDSNDTCYILDTKTPRLRCVPSHQLRSTLINYGAMPK